MRGASPLPKLSDAAFQLAGSGDGVRVPARIPRACCTSKYATATRKQGVILGGLDVDIPGAQHLALRQRSVNRVGQCENRLGPAAREELVAGPHDRRRRSRRSAGRRRGAGNRCRHTPSAATGLGPAGRAHTPPGPRRGAASMTSGRASASRRAVARLIGRGRSLSSSFAGPSPAGSPGSAIAGAPSVARGGSAWPHPRGALRAREARPRLERQDGRQDDGGNDLAPHWAPSACRRNIIVPGSADFTSPLDRLADARPWQQNRRALPLVQLPVSAQSSKLSKGKRWFGRSATG